MSFNEFLFQFPLESNRDFHVGKPGGSNAARGMRVRLRGEQSRQPRSVPREKRLRCVAKPLRDTQNCVSVEYFC